MNATVLPAPVPAPPRRSETGGRILALDGLRGIAIILVLAMHYGANVPVPDHAVDADMLRRLCSLGYSGVDLFFVLSGFLIGGILLDHAGSPRLLPTFYARRFFRIIPLYALLLATFFVGRAIPSLSQVNFGTYFASQVPTASYFGFFQNIAMATERDIGAYWLGPTWSLAVEEQFYLLLPLVVRRLSLGAIMKLCAAVIILAPIVRMVAYHRAGNPMAAVFLLPSRADGLMWGVFCACLIRNAASRAWLQRCRWSVRTVIVTGMAAFPLVSLSRAAPDSEAILSIGYSMLSLFYAALLLEVVRQPGSLPARMLEGRPLAALGIVSYFVYLFHTPIHYVWHWAVFGKAPWHHDAARLGITALALLTTLAAAWASWRWIEAPALRYGRSISYA